MLGRREIEASPVLAPEPTTKIVLKKVYRYLDLKQKIKKEIFHILRLKLLIVILKLYNN